MFCFISLEAKDFHINIINDRKKAGIIFERLKTAGILLLSFALLHCYILNSPEISLLNVCSN